MEDVPALRAVLNRPRRRALAAFVSLAVGLAIGRALEGMIPSTIYFAAAATLLMACIPARSCRVLGMLFCACMVLLGTGWFTLRIHERTRPGPSFDAGVVEVEGLVLNDPEWREADPITSRTKGWWRFDVALKKRATSRQPGASQDMEPLAGVVWIRQMGAEPPTVRAGSRVRVSGRFEAIQPPDNPGESDLRLLAAQRGAVGSLVATDASLVNEIAPPSGPRARTLAAVAWLRARATDVVHRAAGGGSGTSPHRDSASDSTRVETPLSPADAARLAQRRSLIAGLLLGEYDPQERDVRDAFARQGLVHILSISGFHLTVLAALSLMLLRLLGDHGRLEFLAVGAIVAIFMLIVPAQSPIMRSGVLVLAMLLVEATGRRYDRLTVMLWIAIALLLWRPLDLWSLGYQLSTGLTAALLWKGEAFHHRLWRRWVVPELKGIKPADHGLVGLLLGAIRASISTSLLCALLAAPTVGAHAGIISALSVIVGVVVTPVIVLALWVGYVSLIVGMAFPTVADTASSVLADLSEGAIRMVEFFDQLPLSSWRTPPIPWTWAIVTTIAIAWLIARPRGSTRTLVIVAALASWLALAWAPQGLRDRVLARLSDGPRVLLRVDSFSVGDGSYLLVRSDDDAMIWDAGAPRSAGVLPQPVEWARALGAWRVPTLVLTHADVDHYAAADTLIAPLGVQTLRMSSATRHQWDDDVAARTRFGRRTPLETVLSRAEASLSRRNGGIVRTQRDDRWRLGHAQVRVLWPPPDFDPRQTGAPDNDGSLVALLEVSTAAGPCRLLLTGDISDASLPALRALEPALNADVMEAPHHGTTTPGVLAWIAEVDPRVVLQSAGVRKSSDPRLEPLRSSRTWHATGRAGHAWVEIMSDGSLRTSTHRAPPD